MRALILVDIQNDFLPGGALAVPDGDAVIPVANRLAARDDLFDLVIATQDFHPADHQSFAAQHPGRAPGELIDLHGLPQILWPVHCVQGTSGAAFADTLDTARVDRVFPKGTDPEIDSYSGFFDNGHRKATGLGDYLRERGVREVVVVGLATDYCVKATAIDAASIEGVERVVLSLDGCRGVNLQPGDSDAAVEAMRAAGVEVVASFGEV